LYCNATSAESRSVFVRSTHWPSYRASSVTFASSIPKPGESPPLRYTQRGLVWHKL
jgi:hypothetical protein